MGRNQDKNISAAAELRRRAEALIAGAESPERHRNRELDDNLALVHELQVHQIELVMQNKELCQSRDELKKVLDRYAELKRTEQTLRASEEHTRRKLDKILSPEGNIEDLDLADIIDVRMLQSLVDNFYELIRMPMALIDIKGKVLVGVGWQDICTKFHRVNRESCRNCVESDVQLSSGVPYGEYKIYKCNNNMWDAATPIMVGDRHFGNFFMGQFFFEDEPLDYELFRSQARQFGYDEKEYIAALEAVPRPDRKTLNICMSFFMKLADIISQLSYSNIKLAVMLAQRDSLVESLSESEERFRILSENSPDGIALHDRELRHLYVNPAITRITGLPLESFLGKTVWETDMPSEAVSQLDSLLRPVLETGQVNNGELVFPASDGTHFFTWRSVPVLNAEGSVKSVFAIVSDITERKRAEETLLRAHDELEIRVRERTEELAATVDNLRDEIGERKRVEESYVRLNRLYAVLGETNQAIARAVDRDSLFHDFCRIAVEVGGYLLSRVTLVDLESGQVRNVAACGETGYLDDISISVKDVPPGIGPTGISIREGTYYICNDFLNDPCTQPWHESGRIHGIKSTASVAVKEEGWVVGALTLYAGEKDFFDRQHVDLLVQMGTDVSFALDNLAREARRHKAEQALREETLGRLRAVEALREQEQMLLQQSRLAAMGEMINNIAHQWRQPLNVLALLVQQIQLFYNAGSLNKEELDTCVNKSMSSIDHMSQTIDDFRNFFKPDKEQVEFKIHEVVAKTILLLEDSFKNQQIRIDCRVSANPVLIGYPNEYSQVLLNILTNARDALQEKRPNDATVTITISREGEKAVVTIADNADGIAEEAMGKIFEPYFTTKGPDKGTGVGLFMSKTIIEKNMNGRLTARNTAEGAEFRIEV